MALQQPISILEYHHRTKHHLDRYARGPGGLDWADQPDPFRRFEGCERIELPLCAEIPTTRFDALNQPESIEAQPFDLDGLALLLELSFGLSAWKQYSDDRWALRCNPSSGNLHPTEAYLINAGTDQLPFGVYHYISHDHALEKRGAWRQKPDFEGILVGLSSIHWREAWKYGERAFRYCQHDVGHALAALRYAAAVLGWSIELLAELGDDEISTLLGLHRREDFLDEETETPDLLCRIHRQPGMRTDDPTQLPDTLKVDDWFGQANRLSPYHHCAWPIIEAVTAASIKPHTEEPQHLPESSGSEMPPKSQVSAASIIKQRRSAQHFDGRTTLPLDDFKRLLQAISPTHPVPFDCWRWPAKIHLFLFVHRVEGLLPGLYARPRRPDSLVLLKANTRSDFNWQAVDGIPELYRLLDADCRSAAKTLSCHQDIAADSAFSLAMVAEFDADLKREPWRYRRLFWESGLIGQALYLEAEAAGMRGTGIGCFFDDAVHQVLGIEGSALQSLYHFTIGRALTDSRLQTLPPYFHLHGRSI